MPDTTAAKSARRPFALRAQSVDESCTRSDLEDDGNDGHVRRKSQYTASNALPLSMRRATRRLGATNGRPPSHAIAGLRAVQESAHDEKLRPVGGGGTAEMPTPPVTPSKANDDDDSACADDGSAAMKLYDFSRIDYELDRAKAIGKGLWSQVYWAQLVIRSPGLGRSPLTPPSSPETSPAPPCSLFAVKLPARADAKAVFAHEARMLSRLQQRSRHAHRFVVPFHGLDPRQGSLVFEAVLGGSLEHLVARLQVMTELARHLELRALFAGLAADLVAGLAFIHAAGLVHADVKPANVLLDMSQDGPTSRPTLRARFIDFSAAFPAGEECPATAGGTWEYMAPEQMRSQRDWNTPTFASDVWSVGVTLLFILAGGSPYAAACAPGNLFMLREAVKNGDPLGFARMDPVVGKRMAACQDFVDCCRLALQKDRERRVSAHTWRRWVESELVAG